jgi:uncharacterized membrane protein YfhO
MLSRMQEQTFEPAKEIIINEEMKEPLESLKFTGQEVKIIKYEENNITMEADNPGNSMLFLSEVYYPEWKAYVDGKETKIYQAFGLFRSIYLPKGKHKIEFRWDPKIFYLGAVTSAVMLIFIIWFILFSVSRKKEGGLQDLKTRMVK